MCFEINWCFFFLFGFLFWIFYAANGNWWNSIVWKKEKLISRVFHRPLVSASQTLFFLMHACEVIFSGFWWTVIEIRSIMNFMQFCGGSDHFAWEPNKFAQKTYEQNESGCKGWPRKNSALFSNRNSKDTLQSSTPSLPT